MYHDNPKSVKGAASWITLGAVVGLVALLVGSLFPKLIPMRAASQQI